AAPHAADGGARPVAGGGGPPVGADRAGPGGADRTRDGAVDPGRDRGRGPRARRRAAARRRGVDPGVIAGLVMAAGGGTRFGAAPKQLADFHGRPLLEWAVRAQCEVASLSPVVVVLGASAPAILERVAFGRAETVVCDQWASGQAWSLRCGVES